MKFSAIYCLSVTLVLASCASTPRPIAPIIAPTTFSLNQDTLGGHFSYWMSDHSSSEGKISATATVRDPRPTGQWVPFVAVELCALKSCTSKARLDIFFAPNGSANISVNMESQSGAAISTESRGEASTAIPGSIEIGVPIKINVDWRGGRYIQGRLNAGAPQRLALPFTPDSIRITSGSADVQIEDVIIQ